MLLDLLVVSLLSTKALTELIGPGTMITGNQTKEGALEMARRSIKGEWLVWTVEIDKPPDSVVKNFVYIVTLHSILKSI
jgi:hypothetical protein